MLRLRLHLLLVHTIVICMAESNDSEDFYARICDGGDVSIAWLCCAHGGRGLRPWMAPAGLGDVHGNAGLVLAKRVSITRLRILLIAVQLCAWLCGAGTSAYQLI